MKFVPLVVMAAFVVTAHAAARETTQPNVLFISVDDLRPELGCYGSIAKTPNIDKLAAGGTTFMKAYCQQALCAPSRASIMTGLRPSALGVTNLVTHIRLNTPSIVTLSQQFKNHGYHAQSFGKIYHPGLDDPDSWSAPAYFPPGPEYVSTQTMQRLVALRKEKQGDRYIPGSAPAVTTHPVSGLGLKYKHPKTIVMGPSTEAPDVPDDVLEDGQSAQRAIDALAALKDKPFFLAVGFNRPHLPFVAPKKYWDLYDREKIKIAPNQFPPKDVPPSAMNQVGEHTTYWDIPTTNIAAEKQRELIHGYYASVSHVDALVGELLRKLDDLELRENTIVVLWGDHGYLLGEHGLWCKHNNFELSTRVPLIISAPGQKMQGAKTDAVVELVDVYPTLCDLAGLPKPRHEMPGKSLAPLLASPEKPGIKDVAYSEYPVRGGIIGYSMRTRRYRYTEWRKVNSKTLVGTELYDHQNDPHENENIAAQSENITQSLSPKLREGWPAAFKAVEETGAPD